MPANCIALGCKASGTFKFPDQAKNPDLCLLWQQAVGRRNPKDPTKLHQPSKHTRICKLHFKDSDFKPQEIEPTDIPGYEPGKPKVKRLFPGVVPSIFNQEVGVKKNRGAKRQKTGSKPCLATKPPNVSSNNQTPLQSIEVKTEELDIPIITDVAFSGQKREFNDEDPEPTLRIQKDGQPCYVYQNALSYYGDVTLMSIDGYQTSLNRAVLSVASPLLKQLFLAEEGLDAIMLEMTKSDLEFLLTFLTSGHLTSKLPADLVKTCKCLGINIFNVALQKVPGECLTLPSKLIPKSPTDLDSAPSSIYSDSSSEEDNWSNDEQVDEPEPKRKLINNVQKFTLDDKPVSKDVIKCSWCVKPFSRKEFKDHNDHVSCSRLVNGEEIFREITTKALPPPMAEIQKDPDMFESTKTCHWCYESFPLGEYNVHFKTVSCVKVIKGAEVKRELNKKKTAKKVYLPCEVCGKVLTTKSHLKKHSALHQPRNLPCPHPGCPKKFPSQFYLNFHINTHKRRIQCDLCGLELASTSNLKKHKLTTHTSKEDLPFQCSFCAKKFAIKGRLTEHEHIHTNAQPFACTLCPQRFNFTTNLASHMAAKHPREHQERKRKREMEANGEI